MSVQKDLDLQTSRSGLYLLLGLYLILAFSYGVVNPLFEAPDEHSHYFTAQYVADHGRLPVVGDPADEWLGQEAAQPPLYYVLGATLIAPIDTAGAREQVWVNPYANLGQPGAAGNVNFFVHGPWEDWPWRGYALAAHLLRALSSLMGLGTLSFIYGSGRLLWPRRPRRALLAAGLVAFLPQFIFVHSSVTNDALIILLSAAALWQLLRTWRGPVTRRRLLLLGLTVGLAILSKTAGLLLLAYAAGVLLLRGLRRRRPLGSVLREQALYFVLPAALLGGWLLWRNWTLYGDVTAANQFVRLAGGARDYTLAQLLSELPGLWTSLFAVFGWFNVLAPGWVYGLWNGLVLLGLLGGVLGYVRPSPEPVVHESGGGGEVTAGSGRQAGPRERALEPVWLGLWVLLLFAGLLAFMLQTQAAQGRLLFPALLPPALGLAYGLDRLWARLWLLGPAAALAAALYCLVAVIPPVYAHPEQLQQGAVPAAATEVDAALGSGLTLVAYELEKPVLHGGEVAWMTLYWRVEQRPRRAPELVLELFGREEAPVGKFHGYHGRGLYPASLWPEDSLVAERVGVRLLPAMRSPTEVVIQAALAGEGRPVTVGVLEVEPEVWPELPGQELAQLGQGITLQAAEVDRVRVAPGQQISLSLAWGVTEDVRADFTTFVHLGEPARPPLETADSPPLQGYYPTRRWQAGEVIAGDTYTLTVPEDLPAGRYPLLVGMYDPQTLRRLPLRADGERRPHDAYEVARIVVQ